MLFWFLSAYMVAAVYNTLWYIDEFSYELNDCLKSYKYIMTVALFVGGLLWPMNLFQLLTNKEKHLNECREIFKKRPRNLS